MNIMNEYYIITNAVATVPSRPHRRKIVPVPSINSGGAVSMARPLIYVGSRFCCVCAQLPYPLSSFM